MHTAAATATARKSRLRGLASLVAPRPLSAAHRTDLHMVWTLCVANGGMTRLTKRPGALITRGLVVQTASNPRRYYAVTAAGRPSE